MTGRPQWHEGVGDYYATLSRRQWERLGYPEHYGRTVWVVGVSPMGVAEHVYSMYPGWNGCVRYGGCVSVLLHGEMARRHRVHARRCRQVQRRYRAKRRRVKQRRGWR